MAEVAVRDVCMEASPYINLLQEFVGEPESQTSCEGAKNVWSCFT